LLGLVGLALGRGEGLRGGPDPPVGPVDAGLLQLLRRSVDELPATLDHPVDPVVQQAQADEGDHTLKGSFKIKCKYIHFYRSI
jgi:hypothetical protein